MLSQLDPSVRVALVIVVGLALYAVSGWIWPYTACRTCSGAGRFPSPTGKNWRSCGRCGGSGKRVRLISRFLGRGDD